MLQNNTYSSKHLFHMFSFSRFQTIFCNDGTFKFMDFVISEFFVRQLDKYTCLIVLDKP